MSESSKTQPLLDEYGKVKDAELAKKMAYTEKEIRDAFNKTDDKPEVEKWANQASEGVFRPETGKEYSDELKEAQEEAAYKEKADQAKQEIKIEVLKTEEETKFAKETIANKQGSEESDIANASQVSIEHDQIIKDQATTAEKQVEVVANKKFSRKDAENLTKAALGNDVFERNDLNAENELKNESKSETEIKNPDIQALQRRADEELRSAKSALSIFEKKNGEQLGAAEGYRKFGLEDREKVLYRTRALLSQCKSPEEFYDKINKELDQLIAVKNSESEQIAKEKDINKKEREEKRINNKYNFRKDVYNRYLPSQKEEPKPATELKEPVEEQRKEKTGEEKAQSPSKNPTELGNDMAELRAKTYGKTFTKESEPDDARDEEEKIKNGKKAKNRQTNNASAEKQKIEEESYSQEWRSLRERIKQAEKQAKESGDQSEVLRLEEELHKLEQKQRNVKAAAGEKDKEKQSVEEKESTMIKGYIHKYNSKMNTFEKGEVDVDISELTENEKKQMVSRWVDWGKSGDGLESVRKIISSLKDDKEREEYERWIKEKELMSGDFVKVKRSDGRIDDYWEYKGIDPETGRAIVISERFENGKANTYQKLVPLDELKSLNGKGKPAEDLKEGSKNKETNKEPIIIKAHRYNSKTNTSEEIDVDISKLSEDEKKRMISQWADWGRRQDVLENVEKIIDSLEDSKDKEEYRKLLKEDAENKDIAQKLTPENVRAAIEKGAPIEIKVKGVSGKLEDGWMVVSIDSKSGIARVIDGSKKSGEKTAIKDISLEELREWNKPEEAAEIEPEYKGGLPAVIEAAPKVELTKDQSAKVERILKDFDLTAEDAEKIEGFKDLSYGQRLLALENLKQMTLREIQGMAQTEHRQKMEQTQEKHAKSKSWLSKVGLRAKMIGQGATKYLSIAMYKSLNSGLIKEDYEKILQNVVKGMREITKYDVEEKNGKLEIQYLSGLENLNDQEKGNVHRLNEIANELGRMPLSLEQLPMGLLIDKNTRAQKIRYEKLRAEYDQLLEGETKDGKSNQGILGLLERQAQLDLKKEGKDDSDREARIKALTQAGELENIIRLNRFFIENPDVEKELKSIKSGKIFTSALKDTLTERGALFVGGFAARAIGVKALTALGIASSVGSGGIILVSAAGIGGGIGGWRGWRRAEESLREMDAQMRGEDFESKKAQNKASQDQRQNAADVNKKGETIKSSGGKIKKVWELEFNKEERMKKNIVDADGLAERLNMLMGQIEQTSDEIAEAIAKEGREGPQTKGLEAKRFELAHRLETRLGYTRRKLDSGLVNFGKNEEQAFNQMTLVDKLNLAVNCVELHRPTTETKLDEPSPETRPVKDKKPLPLEKRLERFLNFKAREIDQARRWHKLKQMGKGAAYGMGFASAGASARWLLEHFGIVGGGGHIPPHEAGMPAGNGSGKSAYEAFIGNKSKDYDVFPWQKSTESVHEIPMGQGSFAERFLRAAGMHEGAPVKPDLQKIVADYSEYFKNHPDLLKNNNSSLEFLKHLKSDLQNAGLDSEAAQKLTNQFGTEMGKVGTGIYPEGEALPGIETTAPGGGAAGAIPDRDPFMPAKEFLEAQQKAAAEAMAGAKQDALTSAVETASGKLDSVWKMAEHQLDQKGFFKDLSGTAEEIAAKKTYLIDAIKDEVAENPNAFGLKDVDDLAVGQKVDFSKIFENESVLKQILLAKADKLSPQEIASILTHNKNIADFHHMHPDVGITSENVDQIAAGHGDALLKKAVEQAASEPVQPSAPDAIIQPESPEAAPEISDSQPKEYGAIIPEDNIEAPKAENAIKDLFESKNIAGMAGDRIRETADLQVKYEAYMNTPVEKILSGQGRIGTTIEDINRGFDVERNISHLINETGIEPNSGETVGDYLHRLEEAGVFDRALKASDSIGNIISDYETETDQLSQADLSHQAENAIKDLFESKNIAGMAGDRIRETADLQVKYEAYMNTPVEKILSGQGRIGTTIEDINRGFDVERNISHLINETGIEPNSRETVGDYLHRLNDGKVLEIDKDFFNENLAIAPEIHAPNNIHIGNDKLVADLEFKYNSSGQPIELLTPSIHAGARIDPMSYLDRSNLQSFDARADGVRLSTYMEIYNELKAEEISAESGVVAEKIKEVIQSIEKTRHGIVDYSKLPQEIREKLGK